MDIAQLSMALSTQQLSTAVNMAVTKLSMDCLQQNTANLAEMMQTTNVQQMELSVNPNVGSQIDLRL